MSRPPRHDEPMIETAIEVWCRRHVGEVLPITCEKDFGMVELWDDRCVQVEKNTGRIVAAPEGSPTP